MNTNSLVQFKNSKTVSSSQNIVVPLYTLKYIACNIHYTLVTHTRRTAHALSDKNKSSASLSVHEFRQDMRKASEFKTNIQRVINKSGV